MLGKQLAVLNSFRGQLHVDEPEGLLEEDKFNQGLMQLYQKGDKVWYVQDGGPKKATFIRWDGDKAALETENKEEISIDKQCMIFRPDVGDTVLVKIGKNAKLCWFLYQPIKPVHAFNPQRSRNFTYIKMRQLLLKSEDGDIVYPAIERNIEFDKILPYSQERIRDIENVFKRKPISLEDAIPYFFGAIKDSKKNFKKKCEEKLKRKVFIFTPSGKFFNQQRDGAAPSQISSLPQNNEVINQNNVVEYFSSEINQSYEEHGKDLWVLPDPFSAPFSPLPPLPFSLIEDEIRHKDFLLGSVYTQPSGSLDLSTRVADIHPLKKGVEMPLQQGSVIEEMEEDGISLSESSQSSSSISSMQVVAPNSLNRELKDLYQKGDPVRYISSAEEKKLKLGSGSFQGWEGEQAKILLKNGEEIVKDKQSFVFFPNNGSVFLMRSIECKNQTWALSKRNMKSRKSDYTPKKEGATCSIGVVNISWLFLKSVSIESKRVYRKIDWLSILPYSKERIKGIFQKKEVFLKKALSSISQKKQLTEFKEKYKEKLKERVSLFELFKN